MESPFSHPLSEHYYPYSAVSPSAGQSLKRTHMQFHSAHLRHALPLLFYPRAADPRLYDTTSYPGTPSPLLPYLSPFHGRFGVYECTLEPAFIQKRNERERQRVKCVNQGYARLREHLPGAAADKRMSKVETLRAAIRYIKHLQQLVDEREASEDDVGAHEELSDTSSPECHRGASRELSRT